MTPFHIRQMKNREIEQDFLVSMNISYGSNQIKFESFLTILPKETHHGKANQ